MTDNEFAEAVEKLTRRHAEIEAVYNRITAGLLQAVMLLGSRVPSWTIERINQHGRVSAELAARLKSGESPDWITKQIVLALQSLTQLLGDLCSLLTHDDA